MTSLAIPDALRRGGFFQPLTAHTVQLAIFLKRELIASRRFEFGHPLEPVVRGHITLADGIVHDSGKNAHLNANGGIADDAIAATDTVLTPP
jgi:hypothetical protein